MLRISTITEALAELENETGRAWTESELFELTTQYGIELHAAAPAGAQKMRAKFIDGRMVEIVETVNDFDWLLEPHVVTDSHSGLAALFPAQVNELRISGETITRHRSGHNEIEGETRLFAEPVRVTRESVRIKGESLRKILEEGKKMQARCGTPAANAGAIRGIDKRDVMAAFNGLKWDFDHWGKNLASPSDKLKACRVVQGNKKASALWNPADIGVYLLDEGEPLKKLDAVFVGLSDWVDEWREKTALERD